MADEPFPACPTFPDNTTNISVQGHGADAITRCIQAAAQGSTILIPAGTYTESLVIDKQVALQGPENGEVTLYASPGRDVLTLSSRHVVFRNLTLEPGSSQCSSVVNVQSGIAVFDNCKIKSSYLPPIATDRTGSLYFSNCVIESVESAIAYVGNDVNVEFANCLLSAVQAVGVVAGDRSHVRLSDTQLKSCGDTALIIEDNATLECYTGSISDNAGNAIELWTASTDNVIEGVTISDHKQGAAINGIGGGALDISGAEIKNCKGGIIATQGFSVRSHDNSFSGPSLAGEEEEPNEEEAEVEPAEAKAEGEKAPLIAATDGAEISLEQDQLSGDCKLGIIAMSNSKIECTDVTILQIGTGCSVTGGATLTFQGSEGRQCSFQGVYQCAVEAHDNATLQLSGCKFEEVGEIGIFIQNGVRGYVKDTELLLCHIVGIHYVNNDEEFEFERCTIKECGDGTSGFNGVNVKNTTITFTQCSFSQCPADQSGEDANGSGVEVRGDEETPTKVTFSDCTFDHNINGVLAGEGSEVSIEGGSFEKNTVGLSITGGTVHVSNCTLKENSEAAIWSDTQAEATVTSSTLSASDKVCVNAEGQDTKVSLTKCTVENARAGPGVWAKDHADVRLTGCTITGNKRANIEVTSAATVTVERGEINKSVDGIGIWVKGQSTLASLTGTTLTDEKQSAVLVEQDGKCSCDECDISRCDVAGICLQEGSLGSFTQNKIHDCRVGVQVNGGSATISANKISKIAVYGIFIAQGAEPVVTDNVFEEVTEDDVFNAA
jgi:hypothetical protein